MMNKIELVTLKKDIIMEEINEKLKQIALKLYDELARVEQHSKKNILYENSNNNENWHSRILRMLLEYHDDEGYPFLDSFLTLINKNINKKANLSIKPTKRDGRVAKVLCYNEWEHIDTLVKIDNDAIIIENKIYWAVDQDKQIERYIESVKLDSCVENNIYVVYLTSDGSKKIESYSYTEKAKEQLGDQRFIPLNYKEHILPWLENIMSEIKPKDELLYSSILLYANYIEEMFKQKNNQITNIVMNEMGKNSIDTSSLENCFKLVSGTSALLEELNKIKEYRIIECAKSCIEEPLRAFLKKLDNNLSLVKAEFKLGYFTIEIKHQEWKKCYIHLGIWQYKKYGGLAYVDPNNPLDQETIKELNDKFCGWKGDKNEPFWVYFDNEYKDYYSLESWKKIEDGKFETYIEGFIKDIYEKVKDIEL